MAHKNKVRLRWPRQELVYQGIVWQESRPEGDMWAYGPPASAVQVRTATADDLARILRRGR